MTLILEGTLTEADHKSHVPVSFDVPDGTTRLIGRFSTEPKRATGALFDNMVCLSIFGPDGARGARHNNPVRDFAIDAASATPGYVAGPIEPGRWTVMLDTFRILGPEPVTFRLELDFDTTPVSPPEPKPAAVAETYGPGWYRGDLHAHTLHSDADWEIADLVAWARGRNLDFVTLTDHNTVSGHAEMLSLTDDTLLTMGGVELTTHWGHALSLGERQWQEWRTGDINDLTMPLIAADIIDRNGTFIIAHPMSPGDPACTGCRWEFADMMPGNARIIEIWNGGKWADYNEEGLALFYTWLKQGHRLVASAGTDNHADNDLTSPWGFNHVYAENRTESAILQAIRSGHNYLSTGPKLIVTAVDGDGKVHPMGSSVSGAVRIEAEWSTEAEPLTLRFMGPDGEIEAIALPEQTDGKQTLETLPQTFVMAELRSADGKLRAVSNPVFLAP